MRISDLDQNNRAIGTEQPGLQVEVDPGSGAQLALEPEVASATAGGTLARITVLPVAADGYHCDRSSRPQYK